MLVSFRPLGFRAEPAEERGLAAVRREITRVFSQYEKLREGIGISISIACFVIVLALGEGS